MKLSCFDCSILLLLLLLLEGVVAKTASDGDHRLHGYRVIQGDILIADRSDPTAPEKRRFKRSAAMPPDEEEERPAEPWPMDPETRTYVVPVNLTYPPEYTPRLIENLNWTMQYLQKGSGVIFTNRTDEPDYVSFGFDSRCASEVGFRGGAQWVILSPDICYFRHQLLHELMHTLGFDHEMNRPDRDTYIEVFQSNSFYDFTITKLPPLVPGTPYDMFSTMHYPVMAYAISNYPSWLPRERQYTAALIGHRLGLTECDWKRLRSVYPPPGAQPDDATQCRPKCIVTENRPTAVCQVYGSPAHCRQACTINNAGYFEVGACDFLGYGKFPLYIPETCTVVDVPPLDTNTDTSTPLPPPPPAVKKRCMLFRQSTPRGAMASCYDSCLLCPSLYPTWSIRQCMVQDFPDCLPAFNGSRKGNAQAGPLCSSTFMAVVFIILSTQQVVYW